MIIIYETLFIFLRSPLVTESFWPWKNFWFTLLRPSSVSVRIFLQLFNFPVQTFSRVYDGRSLWNSSVFANDRTQFPFLPRWNFRFGSGTREKAATVGRSANTNSFVLYRIGVFCFFALSASSLNNVPFQRKIVFLKPPERK